MNDESGPEAALVTIGEKVDTTVPDDADKPETSVLDAVRGRWQAHRLNFGPAEVAGYFRATCPVHRDTWVTIELDELSDDPATIHPCRRGCLPSEIARQVGLSDETAVPEQEFQAMVNRAREEKYGTGDAEDRYLRVVAALFGGGYAGRRADHTGSGEGRYGCPSCNAAGDGHGLKVTRGDSQPVVLTCYSCRAPYVEILAALKLTPDDVSRPVPKLTFDKGPPKDAVGNGIPPAKSVDGAVGSENLPAPTNPMKVARTIIGDFTIDGLLTLRRWRGGWMRWEQTHWSEAESTIVEKALYARLEHAEFIKKTKDGPELCPWQPNRHKVADLLAALTAITHLPETVNPPTWLDRDDTRVRSESIALPANEIVACTNGLLHVGTRRLVDLTPEYFNRVAVPFDYAPAAPTPARWLKFLDQLWPDDPACIAALQEFFGYVLSGRTDLHKIFLLIGPPRSGKGTIARVLTAMLGKGNAAGPTLASLGTNFGLSPLLGRPLAIVSDARLSGTANVGVVVERLLSISGEDMLTIDRKYREPWTGQLPTRFLVLSNELPRFGDASGAIASRFVVATMFNSFLGKENPRLTKELLTELPGILTWALDGLDRLATEGVFTEPASSVDAILALQDLVSPVAAFVRDRCDVGVGKEITVADLYGHWRSWCEGNGHKPTTAQVFGRDLRAVVPHLKVSQPRDSQGRQERWYVGIKLKVGAER